MDPYKTFPKPGDVNGLWRGHQRNDLVWNRAYEQNSRNYALAQEWMRAAIADGWDAKPTYPNEPVEEAFTLSKGGWTVMGTARAGSTKVLPQASMHAWGPDGLTIHPPEVYSMDDLRTGARVCHSCGATDVDTTRYSFAGRCCKACLPRMRELHEQPGWCD